MTSSGMTKTGRNSFHGSVTMCRETEATEEQVRVRTSAIAIGFEERKSEQ